MKYFKQYTLLQLLNCRGRVYSAYSLVIARSRATKQSRTYDEIAALLAELAMTKSIAMTNNHPALSLRGAK